MRISARVIVLKDDRLLVMDRQKFGHHYLSLVGGQVELGEEPSDAAIRETREESTLEVNNPRLVIVEEAGDVFGRQYIFLCDYQGGEPMLDPSSVESQINAEGQNLYKPMWLSISDLPSSELLPTQLKDLLGEFLRNGFPEKPVELLINKDSQL